MFKHLVVVAALAVWTGCGAAGGGPDGGGTDGGSGDAGGEAPLPCTPAGFSTAPTAVSRLPLPGLTNADEHQAYAELSANDGGTVTSTSVRIDLWDTSDGGPNVPPLSARFNGCDLGASTAVPGVGVQFRGAGSAVWVPAASRFVTFEVVGAAGALVYRAVLRTPQVMPHIASVASPSGPTATVSWPSIPDAGVTGAFVAAYKLFGGGGLQSVGFSQVSAPAGSASLAVSQPPGRYDLEVELANGPISRVRLVSQRAVP